MRLAWIQLALLVAAGLEVAAGRHGLAVPVVAVTGFCLVGAHSWRWVVLPLCLAAVVVDGCFDRVAFPTLLAVPPVLWFGEAWARHRLGGSGGALALPCGATAFFTLLLAILLQPLSHSRAMEGEVGRLAVLVLLGTLAAVLVGPWIGRTCDAVARRCGLPDVRVVAEARSPVR